MPLPHHDEMLESDFVEHCQNQNVYFFDGKLVLADWACYRLNFRSGKGAIASLVREWLLLVSAKLIFPEVPIKAGLKSIFGKSCPWAIRWFVSMTDWHEEILHWLALKVPLASFRVFFGKETIENFVRNCWPKCSQTFVYIFVRTALGWRSKLPFSSLLFVRYIFLLFTELW